MSEMRETILMIKETLKGDVSPQYIQKLQGDTRSGVKQLLQSYIRRQHQKVEEQQRVEKMWHFEREYWKQGYAFIAGIDEVGRGPLAGPVVAAAVILPQDFEATGINDSKKLNEEERQTLRKRIEESALSIGIGMVDVEYIDRYNILQATFEAMRLALSQLTTPYPDLLLVDAVRIPGIQLPQRNIIKGDELSHSIAAASIIAKTTRDAWMRQVALQYPEYGFEQHVGYATAQHLKAIQEFGPTPIHRQSFSPFKEKELV